MELPGRGYSSSVTPPRKKGWNHSERVLVFYEGVPEAGTLERWSIAYYHYDPPFKNKPEWCDLYVTGRTPSAWWPLPAGVDKDGLLFELVEGKRTIPPWAKPCRDVPVGALRQFLSHYGPEASVLVAWNDEKKTFQFVTVGCDSRFANKAVRLRNRIVDALGASPLGPTTEDLRGDHYNVSLTGAETDFLLWALGRLYSETSNLSSGHQEYISKHHDSLVAKLGELKERLVKQPE
jgi:hypothetical protein